MAWSRAIILMQDLASKWEVLNHTFITDPRLFTNKRLTPSILKYYVTYSYLNTVRKKRNVLQILFPSRLALKKSFFSKRAMPPAGRGDCWGNRGARAGRASPFTTRSASRLTDTSGIPTAPPRGKQRGGFPLGSTAGEAESPAPHYPRLLTPALRQGGTRRGRLLPLPAPPRDAAASSGHQPPASAPAEAPCPPPKRHPAPSGPARPRHTHLPARNRPP